MLCVWVLNTVTLKYETPVQWTSTWAFWTDGTNFSLSCFELGVLQEAHCVKNGWSRVADTCVVYFWFVPVILFPSSFCSNLLFKDQFKWRIHDSKRPFWNTAGDSCSCVNWAAAARIRPSDVLPAIQFVKLSAFDHMAGIVGWQPVSTSESREKVSCYYTCLRIM